MDSLPHYFLATSPYEDNHVLNSAGKSLVNRARKYAGKMETSYGRRAAMAGRVSLCHSAEPPPHSCPLQSEGMNSQAGEELFSLSRWGTGFPTNRSAGVSRGQKKWEE